jgi:hypothetical protein
MILSENRYPLFRIMPQERAKKPSQRAKSTRQAA